MSARHRAPDGGDLPSFTGDVVDDLTLTGSIVRRRFTWIFAQGITGFGVAFAVVVVVTAVLGTPTYLAEVEPVPGVIALSAVAVAGGVASLVRRVPGRLRFVLGAVPAAGFLTAGILAGGSYDPALDYVPGVTGFAALVTGGAYVVAAGLKFWDHFKRLLAELDAARPPSAPEGR